MLRNLLAIVVVFGPVAFAADLSEKWQKRLDSADGLYQAAKLKAENTRFYALQKANGDRLKLLKTALADATKAGDFDAATAIKERITSAAKEGTVRAKPKTTVKFDSHEYALIEEKATWHVAKQICEEMGGHLAVINTPEENVRVTELVKTANRYVWIGATDEVVEGTWEWVDGSPFALDSIRDNGAEVAHFLYFDSLIGKWNDGDGGSRIAFLCEWDK
jgi:hypothetical protein